jgi:hypothetical protein
MSSTVGRTASLQRPVVMASLAGLVVFILLFPWGGGVTTDPPTCYGIFGPLWTVPCDGWPAVATGAFMAAAVLLAARVQRGPIEGRTQLALAMLGGATVFVLQFAWGGASGADAPTCFGLFDAWTVPCGGWQAAAMGVVTGVVVLLALSLESLLR